MLRLRQQLKSLLKDAARVAIVGIGSDLRGDDVAGLLALEHLRTKLAKRKKIAPAPSATPGLKLFNGGTAPENMTGAIRRFQPSHLIMIDAVELGKRPGGIALLGIDKIANASFLTHKLPVKLMLDYLAAEMSFITVFIGIQPKNLDFGVPVSKEVLRAGRDLADLLIAAFQQMAKG